MKSVLLICDPHLDNHPMFATPGKILGMNSRLDAGRRAMEWAFREAAKRSCTEVCIMGDLVHRHGVLTPPLIHAVHDVLSKPTIGNAKVALLEGNHDMDSNEMSCLDACAISQGVRVPVYDAIMDVAGSRIRYVRYSANRERTLRIIDACGVSGNETTLLMHHSFQGAVHGTHEFQPPANLSGADIPDTCQVYSGHFHKRQALYGGKVVYPGAIMQHNFGEAGYTPGITFLYEDKSTEFVENAISPRFHIVQYDGDPTMELPGDVHRDYYRFDYPYNMESGSVKEIMSKVRFAASKGIHKGEIEVRTRIHEVLKDDVAVTPDTALEAYTALNEKDADRAARLIKLGKGLLNA